MKANNRSLLFLFFLLFISCNSEMNYKLEVNDFKNKLEKTKGALLIDVRKTDEYNNGHIRNAVNINWFDDTFFEKISKLDKRKPAFIYCLTGGRAEPAAENMRKMGFEQVYELNGGILTWRKAGLPEEGEPLVSALSKQSYDSIVNNHKILIVDFTAKWCRPCQALNPVLDDVIREKPETLKLVSIDVDHNHSLVHDLNINSLPTIIIYKNGKKCWDKTGVTSKKEILSHL